LKTNFTSRNIKTLKDLVTALQALNSFNRIIPILRLKRLTLESRIYWAEQLISGFLDSFHRNYSMREQLRPVLTSHADVHQILTSGGEALKGGDRQEYLKTLDRYLVFMKILPAGLSSYNYITLSYIRFSKETLKGWSNSTKFLGLGYKLHTVKDVTPLRARIKEGKEPPYTLLDIEFKLKNIFIMYYSRVSEERSQRLRHSEFKKAYCKPSNTRNAPTMLKLFHTVAKRHAISINQNVKKIRSTPATCYYIKDALKLKLNLQAVPDYNDFSALYHSPRSMILQFLPLYGLEKRVYQ